MADIEQAIFYKLTHTSAITALVGNRIHAVRMPQEEVLPSIVYFKVSGARVHSLRGPSGLAHPRFQFDIYMDGSNGYKMCKAIAKELRKALDGFRGIVIGVNIQSCLLDTEEDPYEEEPEMYRVSMDFMIMHNED